MSDREEFTEQFRTAVGDLSWLEIAQACKTGIATVKRWHSGESTPHRLGRASVFSALEAFRASKYEVRS